MHAVLIRPNKFLRYFIIVNEIYITCIVVRIYCIVL